MASIDAGSCHPNACTTGTACRCASCTGSTCSRLSMLLMSGLQIFNAHPALYWGKSSYTGQPPVLQIGARDDAERRTRRRHARRSAIEFDTTGVLGARAGRTASRCARGFPVVGHDPRPAMAGDGAPLALLLRLDLRRSTASPTCCTRSSAATCARDLRADARRLARHRPLDPSTTCCFRHPTRRSGEALQRAAEARLPGRHLRPAAADRADGLGDVAAARHASFPAGSTVLGGRQSARTLHFIAAWLLVAFVLSMCSKCIVSGVWNNLRSMITGRYRVPPSRRGMP